MGAENLIIISLMVLSLSLLVRQWLLISARSLEEGRCSVNFLEAYNEILISLRLDKPVPVSTSSTENPKARSYYWYSNLVLLVFTYSSVVNFFLGIYLFALQQSSEPELLMPGV